MIKKSIIAALAGLALVAVVPGQAMAASKFANKDGFDSSKRCDAILGVSDETTSGKVEVFGGFSCPTGYGLANQPEKATIRVRLFENGQEVVQSKRTLKDCSKASIKKTCSSESHQVTWPDDAKKSEKYYGVMEIVSFSGTVTLKTATISS
jgi:hypothetical protein